MRSTGSSSPTRRDFLAACAATALAACSVADGPSGRTGDSFSWGQQGFRDGAFLRPRAIACRNNEVYVIDTTGRVQVFTEDGDFVRGWSTPDAENGTPTAIGFGTDSRVLVPDTHYHRILEYSPDGDLLASWGEFGADNDQFIYPTGIVQASDGRYFITEYGENAERVHVFDAERAYLTQWGGHGSAPGQFNRAMAITQSGDRLCVADTTNHRVQVFDFDGALQHIFGTIGEAPGQFRFPFDIVTGPGDTVLVAEYGNNRITRHSADGAYLGAYGNAGRGPGELNAPRGVAVSASGVVFIADTENHRIQRVPLERVA